MKILKSKYKHSEDREEDGSVSQKSKDSVYISKNVCASAQSKAHSIFYPQNVPVLQSNSKCVVE